MPEVDFSSLFLCRITRCQRGSAPRPTQADRRAILCTWSRGGRGSSLTITGPRKKWQLASSGQQVAESSTFGQAGSEKVLERRKETCVRCESWRATELVGGVLSLHCSPNYPAAVPHWQTLDCAHL